MFSKYTSNRPQDRYITNDITIRSATQSDIADITNLYLAHENKASPMEQAEVFSDELKNPSKFKLYVATYENKVIGYARTVFAKQLPCGSPDGWYLLGVNIHKDYRLRGVGEKLTTYRMRDILNNDESIYCVVDVKNQASVDLHLKLGFKVIAQEPSFLGIRFSEGDGYLMQAKDVQI